MKLRDSLFGIVITGAVLFFVILLLRACTRSTAEAATSNVATATVTIVDRLEPCTADPVTGICYPEKKNLDDGFDHDAFMGRLRAYRSSSSSSARLRARMLADSASVASGSANDEGSVSSITSGSGASTSNGTVYVRSYERCRRGRSLLSIFGAQTLMRGEDGVTFPVLIDGDCPITAAVLGIDRMGGFGGSLDF